MTSIRKEMMLPGAIFCFDLLKNLGKYSAGLRRVPFSPYCDRSLRFTWQTAWLGFLTLIIQRLSPPLIENAWPCLSHNHLPALFRSLSRSKTSVGTSDKIVVSYQEAHMMVDVILFGSLATNMGQGRDGECHADLPLLSPAPISEILRLLGIPLENVNLVMVNHRSVLKDSVVWPGDRVAVFPKEYPIFADWVDHRF